VINYGYFKESHKDRVFSECVRIEKAALKTANGVITVDTRIKEYIAREFDYTGPATIVFNAIDDTRFFPVTKEEAVDHSADFRLGHRENNTSCGQTVSQEKRCDLCRKGHGRIKTKGQD
jgi:hypothetical protein